MKISHEANKIYFQYFPFPSSSLRCTLFWKGFLHTHTLHLWSVYPFIDVGSFPSFFAAAFTYLFSSRLGKFIPPPTCFRLVEDFFRPFSPLFPLPDSSPKAPGEINLTAQHTIAGKICHILCWKVVSIKLEKTCGKHHKKNCTTRVGGLEGQRRKINTPDPRRRIFEHALPHTHTCWSSWNHPQDEHKVMCSLRVGGAGLVPPNEAINVLQLLLALLRANAAGFHFDVNAWESDGMQQQKQQGSRRKSVSMLKTWRRILFGSNVA